MVCLTHCIFNLQQDAIVAVRSSPSSPSFPNPYAAFADRVCSMYYFISRMWIATVEFNLVCYHSLRSCVDTCASIPRLGAVEECVESLTLNAMCLHFVLQCAAANIIMHCGKPNAQVTGNYDRTVPWFG